jgi:CheY-like chemotaxis protein
VEPAAGPIEILLAEDNLADVRLLQECLTEVKFSYHLSLVSDGDAALAFLGQQAPYIKAPTPALLLLDIHLIKRSGWEILAWVRATPSLATIPVVILTGSLSPFDEQDRDRLQPTRCLVKPTTVEEFRELAEILQEVMS